MSSNQLLVFVDNKELPPFSKIEPTQILEALQQTLDHCKQTIEQVCQITQPTWQKFCEPLECADNRLSRLWSPVSHLHSVQNSSELREVYEQCLPILSDYGSWVGQHKGLFQSYQTLAQSIEFPKLEQAQQQSINNALRDFKLSGIDLPEDKQKRFAQIQSELAILSSEFGNNVLDATMAWSMHFDDATALAGLPENALAMAKALAQSKETTGYLLTLDIPCYLAVITYCDDRKLREQIYQAYVTRASDQGPNKTQFDNTEIIAQKLLLSYELAQLLGFKSYSERSLVTKMAKTPEEVFEFLTNLVEKAKPQGEREMAQLAAFANEQSGINELEPWDIAYFSEKLKQQQFSINEEALRPYFPESKVLSGLFELLSRIFGMNVKQLEGVEVWHPDVRFYQVFDHEQQLRGSFYLDLYAREHKQGGAWMDDCQSRFVTQSSENKSNIQYPVAYLTCNFSGPVDGKPALFTHNEVVTLFHEFGHGLHHLLTKIDTLDVSGISGVPWDAVELPSQFLENWCWQSQAIPLISQHYQTGEPLPEKMLTQMLAAKNFQSALFVLRQLEFALFDMSLYSLKPKCDPKDPILSRAFVLSTLNAIRKKVAVTPTKPWVRFPHSFSHIFAGGYSAGYYSYLWAELLASDAFSRFEEEGIFNRQAGQDFLHHILEQGGSCSPMILFERFRGRKPTIDAMLRHYNIS